MDAQRAERERMSAETAPAGAAVENLDRTLEDWWCHADRCELSSLHRCVEASSKKLQLSPFWISHWKLVET